MIDDQTGVVDISKIFADKYDALYNSVRYDNHDMNKLYSEIESHIAKNCPNGLVQANSRPFISAKELKDDMLMLKIGKKEENGLLLLSGKRQDIFC